MTPTDFDLQCMDLAIAEARQTPREEGRGDDIPYVGVVVAKNGVILGQSFRGKTGPGEHAEFGLLDKTLEHVDLVGSVVYVTLEPCSVRGRSKIPCVERLIARRVGAVWIGMLDPDPSIQGNGQKALDAHNIENQLFPLEKRKLLEDLNRKFTAHKKAKPATTRAGSWKTIAIATLVGAVAAVLLGKVLADSQSLALEVRDRTSDSRTFDIQVLAKARARVRLMDAQLWVPSDVELVGFDPSLRRVRTLTSTNFRIRESEFAVGENEITRFQIRLPDSRRVHSEEPCLGRLSLKGDFEPVSALLVLEGDRVVVRKMSESDVARVWDRLDSTRRPDLLAAHVHSETGTAIALAGDDQVVALSFQLDPAKPMPQKLVVVRAVVDGSIVADWQTAQQPQGIDIHAGTVAWAEPSSNAVRIRKLRDPLSLGMDLLDQHNPHEVVLFDSLVCWSNLVGQGSPDNGVLCANSETGRVLWREWDVRPDLLRGVGARVCWRSVHEGANGSGHVVRCRSPEGESPSEVMFTPFEQITDLALAPSGELLVALASRADSDSATVVSVGKSGASTSRLGPVPSIGAFVLVGGDGICSAIEVRQLVRCVWMRNSISSESEFFRSPDVAGRRLVWLSSAPGDRGSKWSALDLPD